VVGRTNSTAAGDHAFVVRFDQTGRPDTTFGGGGGVATLDLAQSAAFAVRMLPDGSVFVAGSAPAGVFLAHVLPDGTADTSFGAGGYRLAAEPAGTPIPASSFRSMEFM